MVENCLAFCTIVSCLHVLVSNGIPTTHSMSTFSVFPTFSCFFWSNWCVTSSSVFTINSDIIVFGNHASLILASVNSICNKRRYHLTNIWNSGTPLPLRHGPILTWQIDFLTLFTVYIDAFGSSWSDLSEYNREPMQPKNWHKFIFWYNKIISG